jgi:hypothetical protein
MNPSLKAVSAEHLQGAIDAVLGIDPSQAPQDPVELNERLTIPQPGITEAITFLMSQQQSKQLQKGLPFAYVLLEAAARAYPTEMQDGIKSKAYITSIAAVAAESKAVASSDGLVTGPLKAQQPELVGFLERNFTAADSYAQKLSLDDRTGLYALCLGMVRAIERHLAGVEKPAQATKEPGRNEPCHCGSGKKYKKCHYMLAS